MTAADQAMTIALLKAEQQRAAWAGLTDEEIVQLSQEWPPETNDWASHIDFTRAIEAKLKEKNGY